MILGCDPGTSGTMTWMHDGAIRILEHKKHEPSEFMRVITNAFAHSEFLIGFEVVGSRPDDDPFTAFKFGRNTGRLQGWLEWAVNDWGGVIEYVAPKTWQFEFGLGDIPPKIRKREHCTKAKELFPTEALRLTQINSDSLLIAEFIRRKHSGELTHGQDQARILRPGTGIVRRTSVLD